MVEGCGVVEGMITLQSVDTTLIEELREKTFHTHKTLTINIY